MKVLRRAITPLVLYFFITIAVAASGLALDLTHLTGNGNGAWYVFGENWHGAVFLGQIIAILIVCGTYLVKGKVLPRTWFLVLIATLIVTCLGFLEYYQGPRYITEVDGHANIRYGCVLEEASTLTNNEPLCVLKRIPNALELFVPVINFVIIEIILAGSFALAKQEE